MSRYAEKITEVEVKLERLRTLRQDLLSKQAAEAAAARRKLDGVAGRAVRRAAGSDPRVAEFLRQVLDRELRSKGDRELFDLPAQAARPASDAAAQG